MIQYKYISRLGIFMTELLKNKVAVYSCSQSPAWNFTKKESQPFFL